MAMGQNPNRTPSEHPIPTKIPRHMSSSHSALFSAIPVERMSLPRNGPSRGGRQPLWSDHSAKFPEWKTRTVRQACLPILQKKCRASPTPTQESPAGANGGAREERSSGIKKKACSPISAVSCHACTRNYCSPGLPTMKQCNSQAHEQL